MVHQATEGCHSRTPWTINEDLLLQTPTISAYLPVKGHMNLQFGLQLGLLGLDWVRGVDWESCQLHAGGAARAALVSQ